ncbi:AAA family ATPase [Micromonospora krabiensis]|uniref:Predicted kinase n=1 Tax=Micromonospora krabiensis TaxID=307121 RepID=A0A1C3N5P1_9ACTN|nr:AAA family ATPase [Micromonospora krabiensis]SBV27891.1 Predicted kinase [Micromonospora krabiensis]
MTALAKKARLIATRGLPGSGKTTKAEEWVAVDPVRRARVNRDDLRKMVHNGVYIKQGRESAGTEKAIIAARDASIAALLRLGIDVINDDTNLPTRTIRDLRRLAVLAGADFEVWDLTDVPLVACIARDREREKPVGDDVIRDMERRFLRGRPYPLPVPDEAPDSPDDVVPYEPPAGKRRAVIVDIDGTVALMVARSPFDESRVHEDRPNAPVIAAVRAMFLTGHDIVFCSGRTDGCREATEKWLMENVGLPYAALHMRAAGDTRKDAVVKRELFDKHIRHEYRVAGVFDDRQQVVDMWRSLGLTVFQVAPGDF